jgi:hypothetical protein
MWQYVLILLAMHSTIHDQSMYKWSVDNETCSICCWKHCLMRHDLYCLYMSIRVSVVYVCVCVCEIERERVKWEIESWIFGVKVKFIMSAQQHCQRIYIWRSRVGPVTCDESQNWKFLCVCIVLHVCGTSIRGYIRDSPVTGGDSSCMCESCLSFVLCLFVHNFISSLLL